MPLRRQGLVCEDGRLAVERGGWTRVGPPASFAGCPTTTIKEQLFVKRPCLATHEFLSRLLAEGNAPRGEGDDERQGRGQ
jgi:hypothetical protein